MGRTLLSAAEIGELDRLYLQAFRQMAELRSSDPLGSKLHQVKLPEALSESIAAQMLPELLRLRCSVERGRGRSDLTARAAVSVEVAVKGTGCRGWVTITDADLEADRLIWVSYADRLTGSNAPARLTLYPSGWQRQVRPGRLRLDALPADPRVRRAVFLPAADGAARRGGGEAVG